MTPHHAILACPQALPGFHVTRRKAGRAWGQGYAFPMVPILTAIPHQNRLHGLRQPRWSSHCLQAAAGMS